MTCVLSMPVSAMNQFNDVGLDKQNTDFENVNSSWIDNRFHYNGLSNDQKDRCNISSDSLNGFCELTSHAKYAEEITGTDCKTDQIERTFSTNGKQEPTNLYDTTDMELGQIIVKKQGVKRKADSTESEDLFIPSKRMSPFLNTPKEIKDMRKKVLKISIKKLGKVEDPEIFLRRTVLVNNTTKRLQKELRQEKRRTKKMRSNRIKVSNEYSVQNSVYLEYDPVISEVHEEITDDMTDTLIKNVLNDKPDDTTKKTNIDEITDVIADDAVTEEQENIDSRFFKSLSLSEDQTDYRSCDGSRNDEQTNKECTILCRSYLRTGMQKMSVDDGDGLDVANLSNVSNREERTKKDVCRG